MNCILLHPAYPQFLQSTEPAIAQCMLLLFANEFSINNTAMYNYYNKSLKLPARQLRNNSTQAEIRLWSEVLRKRKMCGFGFNRQRPVDVFIADFMCKELQLVIEVDGDIHDSEEQCQRDHARDQRLTSLGFTVLRFTNSNVNFNLELVRTTIQHCVEFLVARLYDVDENHHPPFRVAKRPLRRGTPNC